MSGLNHPAWITLARYYDKISHSNDIFTIRLACPSAMQLRHSVPKISVYISITMPYAVDARRIGLLWNFEAGMREKVTLFGKGKT